MWYKVNKLIAAIRRTVGSTSQPFHPPDEVLHRGGGQDDPVHVDGLGLPGRSIPRFRDLDGVGVLNNLTQPLRRFMMDGETAAPGGLQRSMNHMGHPASIVRDAYLNLVKIGSRMSPDRRRRHWEERNSTTRRPDHAGGGVQVGKYIMQATAGCLGSERDRCNICNIGLLPEGDHPRSAHLPAARSGKGGRTPRRGGRQFRHGIEEDRGALGRSTSLPIDVRRDRLIRMRRNALIRHVCKG